MSRKPVQKGPYVKIFLVYRFTSLLICTMVFILYSPSCTTTELCIVCGMVITSIFGAMLYPHFSPCSAPGPVYAALLFEVFVYGVFIFFSGGFASPYLWYFISTLTFLAAFCLDGRLKCTAPKKKDKHRRKMW